MELGGDVGGWACFDIVRMSGESEDCAVVGFLLESLDAIFDDGDIVP